MTAPGELAMFLAIGAAAVGLLFGPTARRSPAGSAVAPKSTTPMPIEEVGARVTEEVEDLRNRLAEVEERLDFAERLLALGKQADQLPAGADR
ncbi:MAG: hypothetical protein H0X07_03330 [Gemmatimonadales bacterium]|nr:hypothetical protein [Gemmatimonadales bacterium]